MRKQASSRHLMVGDTSMPRLLRYPTANARLAMNIAKCLNGHERHKCTL